MWYSRHTSVDTNIVKTEMYPGAVRLECIKRLREYIRNDTEEIMYKVKLTEFVKKMNLKSLLPDIDTDSIMIEQSGVNRLALQLAGFFEHFDSERIQVIGNVEAAYIKQIPEESITQLCDGFFWNPSHSWVRRFSVLIFHVLYFVVA